MPRLAPPASRQVEVDAPTRISRRQFMNIDADAGPGRLLYSRRQPATGCLIIRAISYDHRRYRYFSFQEHEVCRRIRRRLLALSGNFVAASRL